MRALKFTSLLAPIFGLLAVPAFAANSVMFEPDDGTYKTIPVTSPAECSALCKADKLCRGAVTFQPDVTKSEMQCRLNNGFGDNAVFPVVPPEPFDINLATAELNQYRSENGVGPVTLNDKLISASLIHAEDLAKEGRASHTGSDGTSHADRTKRAGYDYSITAENVATGQRSWSKVFKAWQDSPGHNVNLLQPDVTEFGIALVYEPTTTYVTYWSMLVAAPMNEYEIR